MLAGYRVSEVPADLGLLINVTDTYIHGWDIAQATGQDRHSVLVDYDIFEKVTAPGKDPRTLYDPADFNFALRPGSAAVDAGVPMAGINDGYTGRAPDLGAYELGQAPPHYGPR